MQPSWTWQCVKHGRRYLQRGFVVCGMLLLTLLSACQPAPDPVLRIGTNVWPGYEPLYLARDLAVFHEPQVQLVEYRSASQVISGFQKGVIDLAAVTLDEAVRLAASGEPIEVIWIFDFSDGADQVLARPEIQRVQDLKGKRIGVEESALGAFVLSRLLDLHQMQPQDVTAVSMSVSEHAQAMQQGKVDAVITFEPEKSKVLQQGGHTIFSSKQLPGEIVDVLIARKGPNRSFSDQDLIRTLFAYEQALIRVKKDLPAHLPLLNRRMKLTDADLVLTFSEMSIPNREEQLAFFHNSSKTAMLIEQYQTALQKQGYISARCPCTDLLNPRYLEALP